ncbi:MAG: haloalkane dehalogenase [Candidatus Hodarchaeota archaeon]
MMKALRTPVERFKNLPNFPYKPIYIEDLPGYEELRMHYIDEGPKDSKEVFLCLHGQPTWAYLYRKMIPVFLDAGYRAVAPDFFGFGRSDKPVEEEVYTFDFHRGSLIAFIKYLDLKNMTLIGQDWGGIIGLTLPMDMPERITRLLLMNTLLGTGDFKLTRGFLAFRDWVNKTPDLDAGRLISRITPQLSAEEIAAYNAPFPDIRYKAGVRRFPNLVPDRPDAPGAKISQQSREWLSSEWSGETFMAIGMADPVLGPPIMNPLRNLIKNCPEPYEVKEASHFVQEWGEVVAKEALKAFKLV